MIKDIMVFSLTSSCELTKKVCALLNINVSESEVKHFADGECLATASATCDVRGKKVYIIQSTCKPVNDRIMETLIFIDAVRRANCREVTLIIPYFGDLIMSIKNGAFVMPGDKLGIIEQYLLGKGTYEDNGEIKSSVLGNVQIDSKMRTITVKAKSSQPALLKLGDTVYGQITDIKTQRANVNIDCLTDSSRPLALPYMGAIHISQAKSGYLDKLTDAFRIGDIVKAKVVKITGDNVDLATVDEDCGVLKAMCTRCRDYMNTTQKENEVQCRTCKKKEKREVSINYVNS